MNLNIAKPMAALGLGLGLLSTSAFAGLISYEGELANYDPSIVFSVKTPSVTEVGAFSGAVFRTDTNYVFEGFCVELEQMPWSTASYSATVIGSADPRYSRFAKLYDGWYSQAKASGAALAAFATAIREIQYDAASGSLDFTKGNFVVNSGPLAVMNLANQMIASTNTSAAAPKGWEFIVWGNPIDQDVLDGHRATVPISSSLVLLTLGLAGIGSVAYKRTKMRISQGALA